jgi:hypothetical protein
MAEEKERFLSRWSRRKHEVREKEGTQPSPAPVPQHAAPPPELPPLDKLTPDSDYGVFFHPKVDENLRRAALKRLFSDPHFNVMDGLDVYIDDYSKSEPIPAAMLAGLRQAQNILQWAKEGTEEEKAEEEMTEERRLESATAPTVGTPGSDASAADESVASGTVAPDRTAEDPEAIPASPAPKS